MDDGISIGQGLHGILMFIGSAAFNWLPGAVLSIGAGSAEYQNVRPITSPMSATDVVTYYQQIAAPATYEQFYSQWGVFVVFSIFLSLVFAALLIYCVTRLFQVRDFEKSRFAAAEHPVKARDISKVQLRWQRILEQVQSDNDQNWRIAILEADIMLNELLDTLGYRGETMADKMKDVERADFNTIDLAWEAHRMRNQIVHEGSALSINSREARRIISLYERVFREFKFIE